MEALSKIMAVFVNGGFIFYFSMGARNDDTLVLSSFADDTIIFYGVARDNLRYLRCVLLCFVVVSGLKINLAKSELVPVGCVSNVNVLTWNLVCRVSSMPLKYLGLP